MKQTNKQIGKKKIVNKYEEQIVLFINQNNPLNITLNP